MKRGTDMRIIHHERGRDPLYNIWNSSEECMIIYFYSGGGNVVFQNKIYPIKEEGFASSVRGNSTTHSPINRKYMTEAKYLFPKRNLTIY